MWLFLALERIRSPIFYQIILVYKLSPLNWRNKKTSSKGKKDLGKSVHEARYSRNVALLLWRGGQRLEERYGSMLFKNAWFFHRFTSNCSLRLRIPTYQVFSSVTLKALAFSCLIMYREPWKWLAWLVPSQA